MRYLLPDTSKMCFVLSLRNVFLSKRRRNKSCGTVSNQKSWKKLFCSSQIIVGRQQTRGNAFPKKQNSNFLSYFNWSKSFECRAVWPDLAKFRHLGKSFQVFGKFLTVFFGKTLSILWQFCDIIGLIFIDANGQLLKNNITIWSHLSRVLSSFPNYYWWMLSKECIFISWRDQNIGTKGNEIGPNSISALIANSRCSGSVLYLNTTALRSQTLRNSKYITPMPKLCNLPIAMR